MSAFGRAADRVTCPCCKNFGELSHLPGVTAAVPGDVVQQMCDACIDAAFLSGGTRPHPHPFIYPADDEIGRRDA